MYNTSARWVLYIMVHASMYLHANNKNTKNYTLYIATNKRLFDNDVNDCKDKVWCRFFFVLLFLSLKLYKFSLGKIHWANMRLSRHTMATIVFLNNDDTYPEHPNINIGKKQKRKMKMKIVGFLFFTHKTFVQLIFVGQAENIKIGITQFKAFARVVGFYV